MIQTLTTSDKSNPTTNYVRQSNPDTNNSTQK